MRATWAKSKTAGNKNSLRRSFDRPKKYPGVIHKGECLYKETDAQRPSRIYSINLYLIKVHTASKASCNLIFLPWA